MNTLTFDCSQNSLFILCKTADFSKKLEVEAGLKHSQLLLPTIDSLLKEAKITIADVDLIICGSGPGSFTGLRIAMATAKGLACGCDIPVVSVSGLDAYGYAFKDSDKIVVPVIDGKKQRYYGAFYKGGNRVSDYFDVAIEKFATKMVDGEYLIVGSDAKQFFEEIEHSENIALADFSEINNCAELEIIGVKKFNNGEIDNDGAGPLYIRKSQAEED